MNPDASDLLNHKPPLGAEVQTHYPNHYSSPSPKPNPNPRPYSADVTSTKNYGYTQQPLYGFSAAIDSTSEEAGYYQDPNVYNWQIPYDADVVTNGIDQYVAAQVNPISPKTDSKNLQKKQKVPVKCTQCEVCKIECNSEEVLGIHRLGKNHKKNLEKLKATLAPAPIAPSELPNNPVFSSQAQQIFCCDICKIECNSKERLESHEKGKKHKKKLEKMKTTSGPNTIIGPQENAIIGQQENAIISSKEDVIIGPQEKVRKRKFKANDLETKKEKVVENGTAADAVKVCDICNTVCNSDLIFESHLASQRHLALVKKQLAKDTEDLELKEEKVVEKPRLLETKRENFEEKPKLLETKKELVDSGTVVNAVKSCELCDVVCNSDIVFKYHLSGKKHKAMVTKGNEIQQSVVCEICNVVCNSDFVFQSHLAGQRHLALVKKNLAKQAEDLEPKEEKAMERLKLLDTKLKNLVDGGTMVDSVRTCELCDVVCNSDLVYRYHLSGKKHMAMVKKAKVEPQMATEC